MGKKGRLESGAFSGSKRLGKCPATKSMSKKPLPLKVLNERREAHWRKMKDLDDQYLKGKISQRESEARRTKLAEEYKRLKLDMRPFIYKTHIGHYGGLYVMVPEECFQHFKKAFPPREFPRNIRTVDVREKYTFEGEKRFRRRFPNSNRIKEVYFADRSKGLQRIDRHFIMPRPE